MNLHTTTRVPVNDEYAKIVGKAIYMFAYYEWTIIYIIENLKPGYINEYSRMTIKTSGTVSKDLKEVIDSLDSIFTSKKNNLEACHKSFSELIEKRNALMHAHPVTDEDDGQIMAYQANPDKKVISDMVWSPTKVEELIKEIDVAAVEAGSVLEKVSKIATDKLEEGTNAESSG